jgi:hypothetical protein
VISATILSNASSGDSSTAEDSAPELSASEF